MPITFTQYLRPDGRKKEVYIERPTEVEARAAELQALGYKLECEVLGVEPPLPDVSLTISDGQQDVAIELCCNGPEVPTAVDRLILSFKVPA
jgi:hypothetical protein